MPGEHFDYTFNSNSTFFSWEEAERPRPRRESCRVAACRAERLCSCTMVSMLGRILNIRTLFRNPFRKHNTIFLVPDYCVGLNNHCHVSDDIVI